MIKYYFILAILIVVSCKPETREETNVNAYPSVIDSLGLQKAYDDLRWDMYRLYCSDTFIPIQDVKRDTGQHVGLILASLPLNIYSVKFKHDTLLLKLVFTHQDTLIHNYDKSSGEHKLVYGGAISTTGDSLLCYYYYFFNDPYFDKKYLITEKYFQSKDDSIFKVFLKQNKKKLDPWFLSEARKRGYAD